MPGERAHALRVSNALADAFISLARNGDPNHSGIPHWPRHTLAARETMIFGERVYAANDPRGKERALFAKVPFIQWGS
jgi:para-nitrobenzyl esterase